MRRSLHGSQQCAKLVQCLVKTTKNLPIEPSVLVSPGARPQRQCDCVEDAVCIFRTDHVQRTQPFGYWREADGGVVRAHLGVHQNTVNACQRTCIAE